MSKKYSSHLSLKERMHIETDLNQSQKLCETTAGLNRDPVGVRKEILKHHQLSVRQNAKNK